MRRMFVVGAALGAGMLMAGAGSAHALELKDIVILFDTLDQPDADSPYKSVGILNGVAGTIVWHGSHKGCPASRAHSLVYKPGQHAGTSDCPKARRGTATVWEEEGSTANYTTTLTVSGTVLTLLGKMTAQGSLVEQSCHDRSSHTLTATVTQELKIRVNGMTCQVLQYREVAVEDYRGDRPKVTTVTRRLAPKPNCRVLRRSEQPPHPPMVGLRLPNC